MGRLGRHSRPFHECSHWASEGKRGVRGRRGRQGPDWWGAGLDYSWRNLNFILETIGAIECFFEQRRNEMSLIRRRRYHSQGDCTPLPPSSYQSFTSLHHPSSFIAMVTPGLHLLPGLSGKKTSTPCCCRGRQGSESAWA